MRFTTEQYDKAIAALQDAKQQLAPDGRCCVICHDTGHQAWECGHNPLLAMATCEAVTARAIDLHVELHALEDRMGSEDVSAGLAEWRDGAHEYLHTLAGYDIRMGEQVGPARIVTP